MNSRLLYVSLPALFLFAGQWELSAQETGDDPNSVRAILKRVLDSVTDPDSEPVTDPDSEPGADSDSEPGADTSAPSEQGKRWLLILCGLPGDDEYRDRMAEAIEKLYAHAPSRLGVGAGHIRLLVGDQQMAEALAEATGTTEIATAESVAKLTAQVRTQISPADSLWVFMIGHTDLQGRSSRWNVSDADPDQKTIAKWFQGIQCREKVFWITMPLSGFYVRDLSAPGTVVITGTEADLEISATEMPYVFADILAGEDSVQTAGDRDEDGRTSLLDLYLAVCHEIADRYAAENLLLTEHALIDDNGDRRGTELQRHYLPEELGGKPQIKVVRRASSLDGARAAEILLPNLPTAKEETDAKEEPETDAKEEPETGEQEPEAGEDETPGDSSDSTTEKAETEAAVPSPPGPLLR